MDLLHKTATCTVVMIIVILDVHSITDYGLPSFYQSSNKSSYASLSDTSDGSCKRRQSVIKVYLPPEVRGTLDTQPSPTTDVYR